MTDFERAIHCYEQAVNALNTAEQNYKAQSADGGYIQLSTRGALKEAQNQHAMACRILASHAYDKHNFERSSK